VTYDKDLSKLDALEDEAFIGLEATLNSRLGNLSCEVEVSLGLGLDTWEEILDETLEDRLIIDNDLGDVEVSETSHEDEILKNIWLISLQTTCLSQHRLDGTKTPIIMHLLGEKTLGEIVEAHELL